MLRLAGLLALVAACKGGAPRDDATPAAPPPRASRPGDASAPPAPPDAAEIFALFDHLAVRAVKTRAAGAPHTIAFPPGAVRADLVLHVDGETVGSAAPPPPVVTPPWMQQRFQRQLLTSVAQQPDGSWVAGAGQTILLVAADHRPEVGFDVSDLRAALAPLDPDEASLGGDHAFTVGRLRLSDVHRDGPALVIGSELGAVREHLLVGIDVASAEVAWVTPPETAVGDFVLAGGHAITCARIGGRWALAAIALDTGKITATAPLHGGPYNLRSADGVHVTGTRTSPEPQQLTATVQ